MGPQLITEYLKRLDMWSKRDVQFFHITKNLLDVFLQYRFAENKGGSWKVRDRTVDEGCVGLNRIVHFPRWYILYLSNIVRNWHDSIMEKLWRGKGYEVGGGTFMLFYRGVYLSWICARLLLWAVAVHWNYNPWPTLIVSPFICKKTCWIILLSSPSVSSSAPLFGSW